MGDDAGWFVYRKGAAVDIKKTASIENRQRGVTGGKIERETDGLVAQVGKSRSNLSGRPGKGQGVGKKAKQA
jgi:hypothetical protein